MLNFAIMGAGRIAVTFTKAMKEVKGAQIIAVSSKDGVRAKTFAERFHISNHYGSYEEMLQNDEIDVVYIATTHNFHYENLLLCLEYKKHIICEKPMVLTEKEAEEVFRLAKEKQCFVMEAMWTRFLPAIQKAKQIVEEGRIGEIKLIDGSFCFYNAFDPDSRLFNADLAGGALFDVGVYVIETASFFAGENPIHVDGTAHLGKSHVDEVACMTFQYEKGMLASLKCGISVNAINEMKIYGTKGYIVLPSFHCAQVCDVYIGDVKESFEEKFEHGFAYEIQHVVDCIENKKLESDIIPHKDTLACAKIFDKLLGIWGMK